MLSFFFSTSLYKKSNSKQNPRVCVCVCSYFSTMVDKDAAYLVPRLRDLAFAVDIQYGLCFLHKFILISYGGELSE